MPWPNVKNKDLTPSVSVIIPTFNRPAFLVEAVKSVLNQTVRPEEIIIVDNGSASEFGAELSRIAHLHSSLSLIRLPSNKGPGCARNIGLAKSNGDWILFLDDDDVLSPDFIESCFESLRREKNAEMIITRAVCFTKGRPVAYPRDAIGAVNLEAYINGDRVTAMLIHTLTIGSCLVRKNIIGSLRFREDIWHGEDTLFWFLLMQKIEKLTINQKTFSGVRQHPDKLTMQTDFHNPDGSPILSKETYVRMMIDSMDEKNAWNEFTLKIICQRVADNSWFSPSMFWLTMRNPVYGARIMILLAKKRLYRYQMTLKDKILNRKPPDFTWLPN